MHNYDMCHILKGLISVKLMAQGDDVMYKMSAVVIGMMIAIMVFFNGSLNMYLDSYVSGFVIYMVGLITVSLILIVRKDRVQLKKNMPKYLYLGGLYGVLLVIFNSYCFVQIGATLTLTLGLFGQMIFSAIVDHFGLFGMTQSKMNPKKMIGFSIVSAGVILMTFGG